MKDFIIGVFSDGGNPSFSRVATGINVVASIAWVSHLVWKNGALPDFTGLVLFVGALYAANVTGNVFTKK